MTRTIDSALTGEAKAIRATRALRFVLRANAVMSVTTGAIGLVAAPWVSRQLGVGEITITRLTGAALLAFGLSVASLARQTDKRLVRWTLLVSTGDLAWVVATPIVLAAGVLTTTGVWAAVVLALAVADFAGAQLVMRRRALR